MPKPSPEVYRAALDRALDLLSQQGLTQRELAFATSTSYQHLRNVLSGQTTSKPVLERVLAELSEEVPE